MTEEIISPLAPEEFPRLHATHGVKLASCAAGLRYKNRADLMLATFPEGTTVGGVFTRSLCPSAPVDWCRRIITNGTARALVCNAGNANAFTGKSGEKVAQLTAKEISAILGVTPETIFLASTGVIGETLSEETLLGALPKVANQLTDSNSVAWQQAADAIRTTDTFAKGAGETVYLDGQAVTINGIAKGSGMIAPDMATMLSFIFTDAALPSRILQLLLERAVDRTFNCITVDSDTSTSDTVLLFATGWVAEKKPIVDINDERLVEFSLALERVLKDLAHQIVRDGEGATKFVTVEVIGAESNNSARKIGLSIGNSPLVKTMLAAEDANWGRLVMAVGKAGEKANRDRLALWIGQEQCSNMGVMCADYSEERATRYLKQKEVTLKADVGVGSGSATIWTCDLTHRYIDINAGYRS